MEHYLQYSHLRQQLDEQSAEGNAPLKPGDRVDFKITALTGEVAHQSGTVVQATEGWVTVDEGDGNQIELPAESVSLAHRKIREFSHSEKVKMAFGRDKIVRAAKIKERVASDPWGENNGPGIGDAGAYCPRCNSGDFQNNIDYSSASDPGGMRGAYHCNSCGYDEPYGNQKTSSDEMDESEDKLRENHDDGMHEDDAHPQCPKCPMDPTGDEIDKDNGTPDSVAKVAGWNPGEMPFIGDSVTIGKVDVDGLQGRDPHPKVEHEGKTGIVMGYNRPMTVEEYGGDRSNSDEQDTHFVQVKVDGNIYDFADFELKLKNQASASKIAFAPEGYVTLIGDGGFNAGDDPADI